MKYTAYASRSACERHLRAARHHRGPGRLPTPRQPRPPVARHRRPSAHLALRMEAAGWPGAESWMRLQTRYDLAQARRHLAA